MNSRLRKYENCILTLVVMVFNVLLLGILFDFYYDLNDDTMMHDIMAGVYSGTPDGHNMQTLYPLGALIALCYRLCRTIPWYGLFLCLCQFGCFYLVGVRLCRLLDVSRTLPTVVDAGMHEENNGRITGNSRVVWRRKVILLLMLCLFQWGICLPHLLNVQYTITCAVMSAGAIFLFLTTEDGLSAQQFVVRNIPSILLVILAFWLRSEMLLLTFPFICLAGLYRMTGEKKVLAKENLRRYGAVLGIMLAGMLLSAALDRAAYGSAEWKDFRDFFDARTTVYDFYRELIEDDIYSGALTELGVMPHQQRLLRNYNFGLDDAIDTQMLSVLADYAEDTLGAAKDWGSIARASIFYYYYRSLHSQDYPYNMLVLWAYGAVFAAGICAAGRTGSRQQKGQRTLSDAMRRYAFLWQLVLLAIVRSAIWLFILMRGRDPVRITHSLYLVEFALLAAMFVNLCSNISGEKRLVGAGVMRGLAVILVLLMSWELPDNVRDVRADQDRREQVNAGWDAIDAYCKAHMENFYFEDVYSTVAFSHRMFGDVDNSYANYDIMGGWMCKSPLYYEKLGHYHITSAAQALLDRNDVYLIVSDVEMAENGLDWITEYYAAHGTAVTAEMTDSVNEHYLVYQVTEIK